MSKGHLEALAALKVMRDKSTPKAARLEQVRPLVAAVKPETVTSVTQPAPQTVTRGGRGKKVHASAADKQRAYRDRKKAKA